MRAALSRTFECFVLRGAVRSIHVELIADAGLLIDPVVRGQAITGYSENLRLILRREALGDTGAFLPEGPPIFGPIQVGTA